MSISYLYREKCLPTVLLAMMFIGSCKDPSRDQVKNSPVRPSVGKPVAATPIAGKKILLVHSYYPDYSWVNRINQGVQDTLKGTGVHLEIFYMDTKRHPDKAFMIRAGELAVQKVREYKPDLVIAADDAAQEYFARKYIGKTMPIVFCGVNVDPSRYNYPASNITGILERCPFLSSLDYFKKFRPIRRIAVISCDDYSSLAMFSYMKQHKPDVEVVEYSLTNDFSQWQDMIRRYSKTVDAVLVYGYHTLKEHPGDTVAIKPRRIMEWTAANAGVPLIGVLEVTIQDGALAGVVEWPYEQGMAAGQYALKILRGTPPSQLPIIPVIKGQKMINRLTAAKYGIQLTPDLTDGAIIVPEEHK